MPPSAPNNTSATALDATQPISIELPKLDDSNLQQQLILEQADELEKGPNSQLSQQQQQQFLAAPVSPVSTQTLGSLKKILRRVVSKDAISFILPSQQRQLRQETLLERGKQRARLFRRREQRQEQLERAAGQDDVLNIEDQELEPFEAGDSAETGENGDGNDNDDEITLEVPPPLKPVSKIAKENALKKISCATDPGALEAAVSVAAAIRRRSDAQHAGAPVRTSSSSIALIAQDLGIDLATKMRHVRKSISDISLASLISAEPTPRKTEYDSFTIAEQRAIRELLVDLCYALSIYGVPSYRLEHHLGLVASYYGVDLHVAAIPTVVWLSFGPSTDIDSKTTLVRINATEMNLHKLVLIDEVADSIAQGKISVSDARNKFAEIIVSEDLYQNFFIRFFANVIAPTAFSVLLDATWLEMLASMFAGCVIGLWSHLCNKFELLSKMRNIVSALLGGLCGLLFNIIFSSLFPSVRCMVFLVAIASIFNNLPGMTITLSIAELATRNLTAGSSRLAGACVTVIQLFFGVLLVSKLSSALFSMPIEHSLDSNINPLYAKVLAVAVVVVSLLVGSRVPRQFMAFAFVFVAAFAAWFITYFAAAFDAAIGSFLASFAITCLANIYSRLSKQPAIVVSATATIMLVPGSTAVRAAKALLIDQDTVKSTFYVLRLLETAGALVMGMFAGEYAFPVKWRLRL